MNNAIAIRINNVGTVVEMMAHLKLANNALDTIWETIPAGQWVEKVVAKGKGFTCSKGRVSGATEAGVYLLKREKTRILVTKTASGLQAQFPLLQEFIKKLEARVKQLRAEEAKLKAEAAVRQTAFEARLRIESAHQQNELFFSKYTHMFDFGNTLMLETYDCWRQEIPNSEFGYKYEDTQKNQTKFKALFAGAVKIHGSEIAAARSFGYGVEPKKLNHTNPNWAQKSATKNESQIVYVDVEYLLSDTYANGVKKPASTKELDIRIHNLVMDLRGTRRKVEKEEEKEEKTEKDTEDNQPVSKSAKTAKQIAQLAASDAVADVVKPVEQERHARRKGNKVHNQKGRAKHEKTGKGPKSGDIEIAENII